MKHLFKTTILTTAALIWLLITACGSNPLQEAIAEIAQHPEMQNEEGFNRLAEIVMSDRDAYAIYIDADGNLDISRLQETVSRLGRSRNQNFSWDITQYGGAATGDLNLRLMLERSGSMTGYDSRSGSGRFKRVLNELLNRFPQSGSDATKADHIMIVNDAVYPFQGSMADFLQDKDIFATTAGIGDPSYTDFRRIFEYVLNDSVPERITVLVTDMIYSPLGTETVSAEKIFNESGSLASNLYKNHSDKSLLIVKLNADFNGNYYPFNSPSDGEKYTGKRPYYLLISGSAAAMSKLRSDDRYTSFTDFSSLPGYEAKYFFNRTMLPVKYYTVLPRGKENRGQFTTKGGNRDQGSRAIDNLRPDNTGIYSFDIAANLSGIPAADDYLDDIHNYDIITDGSARITKVQRIDNSMINARNSRYLKPATHIITITGDGKNPGTRLDVRLLNRLPEWISASNSLDDTQVGTPRFSSTTFGLLPFLQGIYNAYYGTSELPVTTSMTIDINNGK